MKEYKIEKWEDYWDIFDELINLLKFSNKEEIILDFKDSKKYLNGMTDGWYEFLNAFNTSVKNHYNNLTKEQIIIAEFLISTLRNSLKNR
jgi:hypothetical protein